MIIYFIIFAIMIFAWIHDLDSTKAEKVEDVIRKIEERKRILLQQNRHPKGTDYSRLPRSKSELEELGLSNDIDKSSDSHNHIEDG